MKPYHSKHHYLILLGITILYGASASGQSITQNYIRTRIPRTGISTAARLDQLTGVKDSVMTTVQYFDGLGRPIQTVQVYGSPTGRDLVQPIAYDSFGRESVKYLPYSATAANSGGMYQSNVINDQASFYNNPSGTKWNAPGVVTILVNNGTTPSYAATAYEPSPLNRVIEQGAAGSAWQLSASGISGSGHTVKISYSANAASEVTMWMINSGGNGATGNTSYAAGTLDKTIATDENGNNSYEYKDLDGHVICKTMQNGSVLLSTYYVYDDEGNLTYVIPPIPSTSNPQTTAYPASFLETDLAFLNYIYAYHYDSRNRVIQKKIPGKGWEYFVYNKLDQAVLSQDAVQRNGNQWTVTKYDGEGRVIVTGLWNAGAAISQSTLQASVYGSQ